MSSDKDKKVILSGNEAVARGAYECGVKVAAAYPGTPSTEILENIARYPDIYSEWSVNEKVAFEVALGAAIAGARSLTAMKHVGLNVAADPLMTSVYTGTEAGFVIVSADDPEQHSSQNEQDNRIFGKFAQIPVLEPSSSQEAKDFTKAAFEISEKFDTPVMLRLTTRISHSEGIVTLDEPKKVEVKGYKTNVQKYVTMPMYSRVRHKVLLERLKLIQEFAETSELNIIEETKSPIGVITDSISYQYVKEVLPEANVLKLGMCFPLPINKIKKFASKMKELFVVEELEPFIEEQLKVEGIKVKGKEFFSRLGELNPEKVEEGFVKAGILKKQTREIKPEEVFPRPPLLCPGCAHRGIFYALKKAKATVTGDIGCYTLGAIHPLSSLETCICMGASITNAIGIEKADRRKVVAVLGDSTFFHSGMTGLLNAVYNKSSILVIVLDNRTTAMTGLQEHPGTGKTIKGEESKSVDIAEVCKALGVEHVHRIDPYDYKQTFETIKTEMKREAPSVIVTNRECILILRKKQKFEPYAVIEEKCNGCKACLQLGCPSITTSAEAKTEKGLPKAEIDKLTCTGCTLCAQICPVDAIVKINDRKLVSSEAAKEA